MVSEDKRGPSPGCEGGTEGIALTWWFLYMAAATALEGASHKKGDRPGVFRLGIG